jgi:hypothetical protein
VVADIVKVYRKPQTQWESVDAFGRSGGASGETAIAPIQHDQIIAQSREGAKAFEFAPAFDC